MFKKKKKKDNIQKVQIVEQQPDDITGSEIDPHTGHAYDTKENIIDKKVFNRKRKRWKIFYYTLTIALIVIYYLILVLLGKNGVDIEQKTRHELFATTMYLVGFTLAVFVLMLQLREAKNFAKLRRSIYWHNLEIRLYLTLILETIAAFTGLIDMVLKPFFMPMYLLKLSCLLAQFLLFVAVPYFLLLFHYRHLKLAFLHDKSCTNLL
ncbi:hypothetical protein [Clostridium sp. BNL1100]|uniref:hypothetical protein n=1 Tax=Clostridium sp. BNL1100 TaxID=755731 RepID=UPI00030DFE19|nr:hypothetical protein [Clostridium sp. BNL1100]